MWPRRLRERNNTTEGGRGGEGREWHRGGGKQLRGRGAAGNAPPRPVRQGVYDGGRFVWLAAVGGWLAASGCPPALCRTSLGGCRQAGRSNRVPASAGKGGMRRRFGCGQWECSARAATGGARGATKARAAAQNGATRFGGQHSKTNKAAWRRAAVATPVPCQGWIPQPSACMAVQQHGRATGKREARRHRGTPTSVSELTCRCRHLQEEGGMQNRARGGQAGESGRGQCTRAGGGQGPAHAAATSRATGGT